MKDLPDELQTITFSKVWNKGKDTLWECMLGKTNQSGYDFNLEGFLYGLYYTQVRVLATVDVSLV